MPDHLVTVFDPTAPSGASVSQLATRLPVLAGKRAGILDNGKPNAGLLMATVVEHLREEQGVRGVLVKHKPVSGPAAPDVLAALVRETDFALVGSAD